ncbi:hypothetical protein J2803_003444 [Paraburkholderia phenoliruptrix]|nr:hypothetical protein [Paraburkholderia phenoliruptrix]
MGCALANRDCRAACGGRSAFERASRDTRTGCAGVSADSLTIVENEAESNLSVG